RGLPGRAEPPRRCSDRAAARRAVGWTGPAGGTGAGRLTGVGALEHPPRGQHVSRGPGPAARRGADLQGRLGCLLRALRPPQAGWERLPRWHSGEDVLVQNLLMRRWGGCAILPSGAYHSEVPSTTLNA